MGSMSPVTPAAFSRGRANSRFLRRVTSETPGPRPDIICSLKFIRGNNIIHMYTIFCLSSPLALEPLAIAERPPEVVQKFFFVLFQGRQSQGGSGVGVDQNLHRDAIIIYTQCFFFFITFSWSLWDASHSPVAPPPLSWPRPPPPPRALRGRRTPRRGIRPPTPTRT